MNKHLRESLTPACRLAAVAGFALVALTTSAFGAHYHVYLLGGQSNGNGRADAAQLTTPLDAAQTDVRFYWHRTQSVSNVGWILEDQWTDLAPGSGHGTGSPVYPKEFGCEVSFGRAMADAKPSDNIAIIKYTHGGTNLYSNWSASGTQYTTFVSTVQAGLAALTTAGHTYDLKGMLWQQGEADTGGSNADNYETNLTNLIARVRTDLFAGGPLPFLIGSLSDSQYSNITTVGSGPYKVRQAQETVAAADAAAGIVITDGYSTRLGDSIHLDHTAQVTLGQSFATLMLTFEGPDVSPPVISATSPADDATGVAANGDLVATFNEPIALVNGGTVTIRDLGPGADVVITLPDSRVIASGSDLIIDPSTDLAFENPYAIRISADAVADLAATPNLFGGIADDTTWNFITGTTEPVISELSPADDATGVAAGANLVLTFNEAVQKGSGGDIVIKENGGAVFETIPVTDARVAVSGSTVTVNPTGTFALGTGYHVQVADGAIEDLGGNPWSGISSADTTTWNFTTILPANAVGTSGVFDENTDATNAIDVENPPATLAAFKTAVQTAYDNDLGGVVDWETGVTANPSGGSASNNTLTAISAVFGSGSSRLLGITFDRTMELYTNDINGQVTVLSRQGASHNAVLPAGTSSSSVLFEMTLTGAEVTEVGAAMPSRSTFGAAGVDFRIAANFSGGGSSVLEDTIGNAKGADDTFFHFAAPGDQYITSLSIAYLDDNGQGLTDGQRRPILDDFGFIIRDAPPPPPPADVLTTGVFDENVEATNAIDIEIPASTLASFKTAVQTAFDNDLGGVIDWETGVTATPSSGGTANNTLDTVLEIGYGTGAGERLTITFDEPMELYTNNVAGQVSVLSQQGSFQNAIIPDDVNDVDYTMTFSGAVVTELGAAIPSRSTYMASGVDFRATASFSGGGSEVVDFTVGGTAGSGDTFLHFAAPGGESISSLSVVYLDDNGQGLTNGQRRPILDDLGFIAASAGETYANWIDEYPGVGGQTGVDDDPDGDGNGNGVENFFGTDPGEFSGGIIAGTVSGNTFTFSHPQGTLASDLDAVYTWSTDLLGFHGDGETHGGVTVDFATSTSVGITTVTATVTGSVDRIFVRAEVTLIE
ncbi:Ig-like domain-containing protein [Haloferula helveola]